MSVVLDTSALMLPVQGDIRLFDELERLLGHTDCVVPPAVVDELDVLAGSSTEEARAASVGRDLVDRCRTIETNAGAADDAVLEAATHPDVTHAATTDAALAERLLDAGVSVIRLRGQHKLAITQP